MHRSLAALSSSLGILLATGCYDSPEPIESRLAAPTNIEYLGTGLDDSSGSISGTVVNGDSLPVPHSRVLVYLVGPIPPDSAPPDTTPPDSVPPDTTSVSPTAYALPVALFRNDSVPGDSTPPPPPTQCGSQGLLVARARADRDGRFLVSGLASGVYDLRAEGRGRQGTLCGAILRDGQQLLVTIPLTVRKGLARQ